jgi:hypothetical protein
MKNKLIAGVITLLLLGVLPVCLYLYGTKPVLFVISCVVGTILACSLIAIVYICILERLEEVREL